MSAIGSELTLAFRSSRPRAHSVDKCTDTRSGGEVSACKNASTFAGAMSTAKRLFSPFPKIFPAAYFVRIQSIMGINALKTRQPAEKSHCIRLPHGRI